MAKDKDAKSAAADLPELGEGANGEEHEIKVTDRRHSARADEVEETDDEPVQAEPRQPTIIDEYRARTEEAERKLQEYIEAYKTFRGEQDQVRERLARDVDRRVDLRFAGLVGDLLQSMDHLDLALGHAAKIPEAQSLAEGVRLAITGFLTTLERNGVEKVVPDGRPFDPNEAEALRMDPVDSKDRDGVVTETLQPGYRLRDTLIRPARVAVGRYSG